MFEKIVLRRSEVNDNITVGELSEALLFYQNVHLVLDYSSLIYLGKEIGIPKLLSLIQRPNISAIYCIQALVTRTETFGVNKQYNFSGISIAGSEKYGTTKTNHEHLEFVFINGFNYSKRDARSLSEKFINLVPIKTFESDFLIPGGIFQSAKADLDNTSYIHTAIQKSLNLQPGVPKDYQFKKLEIVNTPSGFFIFSDIDFKMINRERERLGYGADGLSHAHLINTTLDAKADTLLAAHYGGDFQTSVINSEIIRLRYSDLLRRSEISVLEKNEFQNIVISDCSSIKEVMDNKQRTFDEFLKLLDKSHKFREWIQKANPDDKLVKNYIQDVTSIDWGQKLPTRIFRYMFTNGVGAWNPVAGIGLSLADSFLLDKISKGWKPNHFIEKQLKPFLKKKVLG